MDGVLHPAAVTTEYCRRLVKEYGALDCAQVYTLLKKYGRITSKKERNRITKAMCSGNYAQKIDHNDRTYFVKGPGIITKERYKEQILCFWVLLEYIDRVDRHFATGTFSRISMEINGRDYNVLHVKPGSERFCNANMKQGGETRYFVVVDDANQIPLITGDRIHTFATVSDTGKVQYYAARSK